MPFNSFPFVLLFLPVVVIAYRAALRISPAAARGALLLSSLLFYALNSWKHLPVLIASILVNFVVAHRIAQQSERRPRVVWLWAGIVFNLGLLCLFKYASTLPLLSVAIPSWGFPLGLSFFTLQQVALLVDVYEELLPPQRLGMHALFVSFFPYVTAGPISRGKRMFPQLERGGNDRDYAFDAARGLAIFGMGLFKKAVFAECFRTIADKGLDHPYLLSSLEAWICSFAYTMQIYFDFSGYTDMAIGVALLIGFDIPRNFDAPYRSRSIIEFWQRWHISLSQFITTYLYTPIIRLFRRATLRAAAIATMASMLIAGIWHGSSWNFVIFGGLHGLALVANQLWKKKTKRRLPALAAWALTLTWVNLAFIFFRLPDLSSALHVSRMLIPFDNPFAGSAIFVSPSARSGVKEIADIMARPALWTVGLPALIAAPLAVLGPTSHWWLDDFRPTLITAAAIAAILLIAFLFMNSANATDFIYFRF
ncbi:MAG: alginate O-acetyltransferase complex protein AlgI [Thermoanaerobaculia bacterium]|jgi:D-alanyl-lipoteichoic acid acyltransferase DltB (MBOAT superfamily)|nr:alginate O-acetyltransferase complex protein AlgI [Thermoanaerobaculia bacterium]